MSLVSHDILIDPLLCVDIEGRTVIKVRLLSSWSLHSSEYSNKKWVKNRMTGSDKYYAIYNAAGEEDKAGQ